MTSDPQKIRIALDAMGGDNAPEANLLGAYLATKELDVNEKVVLVGDTKLANHLKTSNSTHLNESNQEAFDLQTYKKFLSFLKFQEMMEKYNT